MKQLTGLKPVGAGTAAQAAWRPHAACSPPRSHARLGSRSGTLAMMVRATVLSQAAGRRAYQRAHHGSAVHGGSALAAALIAARAARAHWHQLSGPPGSRWLTSAMHSWTGKLEPSQEARGP